MGTGDNNTTWGDITNTNLGTAIEEAIVGSADVSFSSADVTLTLSNLNTSQNTRNMRLRCTGTTGGSTRNLIIPKTTGTASAAFEKPYIIQNDCADSITVKTSTGTGVTVPAGKTMWVYADGTNVVDVVTALSSLSVAGTLTLSTALPIASGGTGANTAAAARTALGTAASGANSDITSLAGLTTALSIAQGGTGANTAATARTSLGATTVGGNVFTLTNPSAITFPRFNADNTVSALDAATFRTAIGAGTGSGTVTSVGGTGSINGLTLTGTVTSSGSLTLGGSVTSVNNNATVNGVAIGYRSIPRSTTSGTATVSDVGQCIAVTAGITIPNSTFAAGDAISIYNNSSSSITITQGSGLTMYQVGTATTGNRTLAQRGMATIWFNSATDCVISGGGLS
jgi:hypothetical protein